LSLVEIEGYVDAEQPLDCAGSFKCEGLGVALFEKMEGDDPNSLIGLPLIKVSKSLSHFGLNPLTHQTQNSAII
jgi:predicted house-cleaning NTP pyrophosphatase (Maf/HAM1 superfamily)